MIRLKRTQEPVTVTFGNLDTGDIVIAPGAVVHIEELEADGGRQEILAAVYKINVEAIKRQVAAVAEIPGGTAILAGLLKITRSGHDESLKRGITLLVAFGLNEEYSALVRQEISSQFA